MPNESQAQAPATVAVGAVVVDSTGRFLLIRRARPPMQGAWTLPGGRVEPGESLEGAVVRELHEETGLTVRVIGSLGTVTIAREGFVYVIHEHLGVVIGDAAPRAGDDAGDVRWARFDELRTLGVLDDAAAVIARGLADARARGIGIRTEGS